MQDACVYAEVKDARLKHDGSNPFDLSKQGLIQECAETWQILVSHGIQPQRALGAVQTIVWRLKGARTGKTTALKNLIEAVKDGKHIPIRGVPHEMVKRWQTSMWFALIDQATAHYYKGPPYSEL